MPYFRRRFALHCGLIQFCLNFCLNLCFLDDRCLFQFLNITHCIIFICFVLLQLHTQHVYVQIAAMHCINSHFILQWMAPRFQHHVFQSLDAATISNKSIFVGPVLPFFPLSGVQMMLVKTLDFGLFLMSRNNVWSFSWFHTTLLYFPVSNPPIS